MVGGRRRPKSLCHKGLHQSGSFISHEINKKKPHKKSSRIIIIGSTKKEDGQGTTSTALPTQRKGLRYEFENHALRFADVGIS